MTQVSGTGRGKNHRPPSVRKVAYAVGLLIAVLGGLFVSFAPSASADTEANVPPVGKTNPADYATYPDGVIPGSCSQQGAGVLTGVSYTINHLGVDRSAADLSNQQLFIADVVTMSWTGYAEGCDTVGVSLAVKSTDHNIFVITDNQHLVSYQYCSGADCPMTNEGVRHLSLTVPSKQDACNFQFDAVLGPPLQDVGPNGSYYSNDLRQQMGKHNGPNTLISFSNGGKGACVAPTATGSQSCTTEGGPAVALEVVNNDVNDDATVDVLKNGTVVNADVNVPVGQTVTVNVPFTVSETGTVSINWTGSAGPVIPVQEIFSQEFTFNCLMPSATISHSCAVGGVEVDFTNGGTSPATMVVTKGGVVIDTVTVAGNGTEHRTYPMAEDETAIYRVTSSGFDSGDVSFTNDCVEAETSTSTTVPDTVQGTEVVRGTTLPRTGSGSTLPLSTMAGLLLMTGGLLLALANRPVPTTATASTRSRGR